MDTEFDQIDDDYILVVDDTFINLEYLTDILVGAGYKVQSASSGELALKIAQIELPTLILLDIMMPEMDGYEVCEKLKSNEKTRSIPIIFISALAEKENKSKGFQVGAVDYIPKPFYLEEILARVKVHFDVSQMKLMLETQNIRLQQEINDRKKVEEEVELERNLMRTLMDHIPITIYFKDLQSKIIRISRSWAINYGNTDHESYIGLSDFDVFSKPHAQKAFDDEQNIIRTGKPMIDLEEEETYLDKPSTWSLTSKMPLYDRDG